MRRTILVGAFLLVASTIAQAQQEAATVITKAQIDQGLELPTKSIDRMLRILDLGTYQLAIAVAKHEPTTGKPGGATGRYPNAPACGVSAMPAGAEVGPGDGISHDDITETYVILSGSGTLVTGGQILNGFRSAPDSDTNKILDGPSCIGEIVGNVVRRKISPGDVVVIPAGVPHGWADLSVEITYLTVRPDPKKILQQGYVNPAIQ
jgi:hypothetical protein